MKVFANPRMIACQHLGHRPDHRHAVIGKNGDTVANCVKTVQIVGHHEDGQTQRLLEPTDQLIKRGGADRIEPSRGFVEEENIGIESQRPCQPGAFAHPPDSCEGNL